MIRPAVTFCAALDGAGNAALRARIAALAPRLGVRSLRVDSLLAAYARLRGGEPASPGVVHLLLDPHRWVLYGEPPDGPRLGSVLRFLVDGYPLRPFARLLAHAVREPYCFLYPLQTLDILPRLWAEPRPGTVIVCDLVSGEIRAEPAQSHPAERPPTRVDAPRTHPPLRARRTGPSLRAAPPADLTALGGLAAGVVRERLDTTSHPSLPYAIARLQWGDGTVSETCSGKALRPADAARVALCEAVERFQVAHIAPGEALVRGSHAAFAEHAVDPRDLFFSTAAAPFGDREVIHWTSALDVRTRASVLVPAQEVWFSAPETLDEPHMVSLTTSGSALGGSPEEAAIFALFEAVERDAYLTMWYTRRPCARIDPESVRNEGFQLLRRRWAWAYPGYDFALFDATTDVALPTVVAIAVRRRAEGRMTFHAAATRLTVEAACFAALKDLGGFTPELSSGQRRELAPLLADPSRVTGPEGHFGLYSLDETFERLGFLDLGDGPMLDARDAALGAWFSPRPCYDLRALLEESAERMHPLGSSLIIKTITHPEMKLRGVHCVRAVTPGLFPMWFGERGRRFAVTERLRRLARDFAGRALSEAADFNLQLHPFS